MTIDQTAHAAKHRFHSKLRATMRLQRWAQKDIAELTGRSPSSVSIYMRDPDMITAGFIKDISTLVPSMSREYQIYMNAVDGRLLNKRAAADAVGAVERMIAFRNAKAAIIGALDQIGKLLE